MQNRNKRDPAKEQFWREMISKQKRSGVSQKEFCRNNGLKPNTFYSWKKIIHRRNRERANENRRLNREERQNQEYQSRSFVPIVLPASEVEGQKKKRPIAEIRIGRAEVSVFPGADLESLQALMIVLKEL